VRSRTLFRMTVLAGLPVAGVVTAVLWGDLVAVFAVGAAFAAGHAVGMPSRAGKVQPLSPAVAVAAALVSHFDWVVLTCSGAVGIPAGWLLIRVRHGARSADDLLPAELAGLGVFIAVATGIHGLAPHAHGAGWAHLSMVTTGSVAWYFTSAVVRALSSGMRQRMTRRLLLLTGLADWPPHFVLLASGAIYGVTEPDMGWWALLLATVPFGFARISLRRLAVTEETYRQTIHTLGRIPEAAGLMPPGHGARVADGGVAMAGELGFGPRATERIEFAAHLHDIGRVVLADPAVAGGGHTDRDVAQWSSAIIAEAPYLEPVAAIVGETHRGYRRPGEVRDEDVPVAAQVVKVAAAYDLAVSEGMEPVDALEVLHRGAAYDYDPVIVAALRRVLQRRGVAGT
jgi:hypothetical protein